MITMKNFSLFDDTPPKNIRTRLQQIRSKRTNKLLPFPIRVASLIKGTISDLIIKGKLKLRSASNSDLLNPKRMLQTMRQELRQVIDDERNPQAARERANARRAAKAAERTFLHNALNDKAPPTNPR